MDKILVVEDDKTVYSGIKKLLELQHYSVVIAQNGMEALEKIDESFSLVIMDIMMPQLDGIETCRRMRERYSVPILFLSAKSEELDKLEGLEVGGDDYMTKPFSNMELISKVKALIISIVYIQSGFFISSFSISYSFPVNFISSQLNSTLFRFVNSLSPSASIDSSLFLRFTLPLSYTRYRLISWKG